MTSPDILGSVPLFSGVSRYQLAALEQQLGPRTYRAGQVIFHQSDPGASLHIIRSGTVKIVLVSAEGEELVVAMLRDGDYFGELSLLDGKPRSATAVAVTDCETWTLGRAEFLGFMKANPDAGIAICAALAGRLRDTDERLAETIFLDLPARLGRRLAELARTHGRHSPEGTVLDLPLSQRDLAELTGATRQSVNQVLSRWEQEGVVRRGRRSLVVLQPGKLR